MIDMHNHILYGVDDGAQTIDDSLAMIYKAAELGFDTLVLTPHYMVYKNFTSPVEKNRERLAEIREATARCGIPMTLILGNELLYEYELVNRIDDGVYIPVGKTKYFLIETTRLNGTDLGIQNFIRKLNQRGYKAVLAHPERYDFVQSDPNVLIDFISQGVLIQSNYLSLLDYYDQRTTETIKIMLEHHMVHMMGSDAHQTEGYELYPDAERAGIEIVGKDGWRRLMEDNPRKFLCGKKLDLETPEFYRPPIRANYNKNY